MLQYYSIFSQFSHLFTFYSLRKFQKLSGKRRRTRTISRKKGGGGLKLASQRCMKREREDRRGALENKRESEMVAGGLSIFFIPKQPMCE